MVYRPLNSCSQESWICRYLKVGVVLTQSNNERAYNVSGKQIALMAQYQAECGNHFVSAIVSLAETENDERFVNFEAFQVSDQCVRLYKDGWFKEDQHFEEEDKRGFLQVNKEVIVAGKDTLEIDTDFLLVVVPILDHKVSFLQTILGGFNLNIAYWTNPARVEQFFVESLRKLGAGYENIEHNFFDIFLMFMPIQRDCAKLLLGLSVSQMGGSWQDYFKSDQHITFVTWFHE